MLERLFLTQKRYVNFKVEQADLDQRKSSSLVDINYNITLANLECFPDKPPLLKLSCVNKGIIPLQWGNDKEIYIPKDNPPTGHNISHFAQ